MTNEPVEITVDRDQVVSALRADAGTENYALAPSRVYLDRERRELLALDLDDRRTLRSIERSPERFVEIPILTHGQWHDRLREFLRQRGREQEYFGSIGGWLEQYADETDRVEWEAFRDATAIEHAVRVAEAHRIRLRVST